MTVGFEAKRLFKNFTGLGNYCRFVVDALSTYAPQNAYLLYTPKLSDHPEVVNITERKNVRVVSPPSFYANTKLTSLWRSWGASKDPTIKELDVYHGLSHELPIGLPSRIKKVVTVHDLIFLRYPAFYSYIDAAIYRAKVKAACRNADSVIAISEQTAQDLVTFLKVDEAKISIVHQGCHPIFHQKKSFADIENVKNKYGIPEEYILNVGTIEERKNLMLLIKALAILPNGERPHLVVIGRKTEYANQLIRSSNEYGLSSDITFIHDVSFKDLPALYQGAKVFIYPSLFEGFGIPLIEAIASHVPVITTRGSCFSEAAGPSSIYVDPKNEEELATQLRSLLQSTDLRNSMIASSLKFIQKFNPSIIAGELLNVYRQ